MVYHKFLKNKKIINVHTYTHTYTIIFFGNFVTYGIPYVPRGYLVEN